MWTSCARACSPRSRTATSNDGIWRGVILVGRVTVPDEKVTAPTSALLAWSLAQALCSGHSRSASGGAYCFEEGCSSSQRAPGYRARGNRACHAKEPRSDRTEEGRIRQASSQSSPLAASGRRDLLAPGRLPGGCRSRPAGASTGYGR